MRLTATCILRTVASLALVLLLTTLDACTRVPVSGRRQLNFIPDSQIMAMSYQQYGDFLLENRLSEDEEATALVKKVGRRIQRAVEEYFRVQNISQHLDGYAWEFNLIESDQVNAWCMPGGKVVLYTGILPICQDEMGIAVVMGHEVAHAVAEHGAERMSQGLLIQTGGVALSEALESQPEQTRALWMTAFAVGAQYGAMLPYSRLHESEADRLGLLFMAMASYDPRAAPDFWRRMSAQGGASVPEFMSTHPSDETRIRQLNEYMAEALQFYNP